MKIAYFSKYSDQGPSSRYRVFQFADLWNRAGVDLQIHVLFDKHYLEIMRMAPSVLRSLRKSAYVAARFHQRKLALKKNTAGLSIIEHQLFPYLPFALEQRYLPDRYVVEFDDAIYLTHPRKLPRVIENAVGTIVGNEGLGEYARQYGRNVFVVPTVLNTEVFRPEPKREKEKIVLGWSGLEYNFKYIRALGPVLQNLLRRYPVEIVILSGAPPHDFPVPFRFEKWVGSREVALMNEFDIGLMPLEMDEWSKGKCGIKLLQYMSLGIASVATPVGVNTEIIQEGENGFTARDPDEWEHRLTQLVEDRTLRQRMGSAARRTVEERYSTKVWFPRLLDIYKGFL